MSKINKGVLWALRELSYGPTKLPRKIKKRVLGKRMSGSELRRRLRKVTIGEPIKTMYERPDIKPYGMFCPKCGQSGYYGTGNRTDYPEHWEYFFCIRCHSKVGVIDNSPFYHALQFSETHYDPTF